MAENNFADNDDLLNRYLEGKSELSDQYREAASETPPRHLDRAVLTAARKAVGAGKHIAFSPFASDWHIPVSLAAVLVLSVAVVVIMRNESSIPPIEEPLKQERLQPQEDLRNAGDEESVAVAAKNIPPAPAIPEKSTKASETSAASVIREKSAVESLPDAGASAASRSAPAKTTQLPEFDELFIAGDVSKPGGSSTGQIAGNVEGAGSRSPPATTVRKKITPLHREAPAMLRTPSPQSTVENKVAAAETGVSVSRSTEGKFNVQSGLPQLFIGDLTGQWSGTAVTTPLGPVPYDITFKPVDNCVSGTAHPGTNHTWTFCISNKSITLDFLTDFRGNQTPIHFHQLAYNDGVYTFKAATHEFMELLVFADKDTAWMKIFHYGKLHVEIQLKRKQETDN